MSERPTTEREDSEVIRAIIDTLPEPLRLLETLLMESPVAQGLYDAQGHPLFLNRALRQMFNNPPPPGYSLLRDTELERLGMRESLERAFAGVKVHAGPYWYNPRNLEWVQASDATKAAAFNVVLVPLLNAEGATTHVLATYYDVTGEWNERTRAEQGEEALQRGEARFRRIFESSLMGLTFATDDGRILEANDAFLNLVGSSRDELEAGRLRWDTLTPPEYAAADLQSLHELRRDGVCTTYEKEYLRPDGRRVSVMIGATRIQETEHNVVFVLDISEQKRLEDRLAAITEIATMGLLMQDERGHCIFLNPAAEEILGRRLDEIPPVPLHDLIHHSHEDGRPYPIEECPIERALSEHRRITGEEMFVRGDGTFFPVAYTASPIVEGGRLVGTVVELRDTTAERRHREERLSLLNELQQAVRTRDEFLSIASHELKTPLTPLTLKLQAMERILQRMPPSPQHESLSNSIQICRRQVARLSDLVGDLLDVTRSMSGRLPLSLQDTDLTEIVEEVARRYEDDARRKSSRITLLLAPHMRGHWDPLRLEQIVTNLVDNALKYGEQNPVTVRLSQEGNWARLEVEDQGIGIDPETQKRIFGRFARGVSDRYFGGLGLGLYITRTLVEAMRGRISVKSEPGVGSVFTVLLPLEP